MNLLLAPLLTRVIFIEPDKIAIVAFVQRLILENRDRRLAQLGQHQVERALRAFERGRKCDVELDSLRLELTPGLASLGDALFGEVDVAPTGEQIFQVPIALAVAHEHEKTVSHAIPQKSFKPRTSIIE